MHATMLSSDASFERTRANIRKNIVTSETIESLPKISAADSMSSFICFHAITTNF